MAFHLQSTTSPTDHKPTRNRRRRARSREAGVRVAQVRTSRRALRDRTRTLVRASFSPSSSSPLSFARPALFTLVFILSCDGRLTSSNIDQRRTRKTRQRWQTSISRTERRCSRMPSRRIPSSARSGRVATRRPQRRQKVRSSPLKFCEAFVFS